MASASGKSNQAIREAAVEELQKRLKAAHESLKLTQAKLQQGREQQVAQLDSLLRQVQQTGDVVTDYFNRKIEEAKTAKNIEDWNTWTTWDTWNTWTTWTTWTTWNTWSAYNAP